MAAPIKPKGAKSDKEWRDAIRAAVYELRDDPNSPQKIKALRLLARTLVDRALEGDVAALREIGDRLDGKSTQPIGGDSDHPVRVIVEIIDPTRKIATEVIPTVEGDSGNGGSENDGQMAS